jgi:hypothetical protein
MGGIFTVRKVREGLAAHDYSDRGPYKNPEGIAAYEFKTALIKPSRQPVFGAYQPIG